LGICRLVDLRRRVVSIAHRSPVGFESRAVDLAMPCSRSRSCSDEAQEGTFLLTQFLVAPFVLPGHHPHGPDEAQIVKLASNEAQIVVSGESHDSSVGRTTSVPTGSKDPNWSDS